LFLRTEFSRMESIKLAFGHNSSDKIDVSVFLVKQRREIATTVGTNRTRTEFS